MCSMCSGAGGIDFGITDAGSVVVAQFNLADLVYIFVLITALLHFV